MKQTTIPVRSDSKVTIKCNSDLSVEGVEPLVLTVIVDQGECLRMREENGQYRIFADTDCRVLLPASAMVTIEKTGNDCSIKNMHGRLVIGKVSGDLRMDSCNGASVESVGGECIIHNAGGAVEIARIGEMLHGDGVADFLASAVGDDVVLTNIRGKIDVVAGDEIRLQVENPAVPEIKARAGSDIKLYLPQEANCQLNLTSGGEEITIHANGQDVEVEEHVFSLPLGQGGLSVDLNAGDGIDVTDRDTLKLDKDFEWDSDRWNDFGFEIARKVKNGLARAGASMDDAFQKAGKAGEEAAKQVRRAFKDLEDGDFLRRSQGKMVGFSMNQPKTESETMKAGPSDEERMLVLKMLQEKKISVEEAEKLLYALDR